MAETDPDSAEWGNEVPILGPDAFVCGDRSGDRFCCYVLASRTGKSKYVGMTCDVRRRIRQHNKEIKGGARATSRGGPWRYAAVLGGFADHHEALTAEWRLKRLGRAQRGAEGLLRSLGALLERSASAPGSATWTSTSAFDFRSSGLSLYVAGDMAEMAPGLEAAARGVGWAWMTSEALDPAEVAAWRPTGLFRQPPRQPGASASSCKSAGCGCKSAGGGCKSAGGGCKSAGGGCKSAGGGCEPSCNEQQTDNVSRVPRRSVGGGSARNGCCADGRERASNGKKWRTRQKWMS
jgi:predicted GIY-YIG superfamily endonuclease